MSIETTDQRNHTGTLDDVTNVGIPRMWKAGETVWKGLKRNVPKDLMFWKGISPSENYTRKLT